MVMKTKKRGSKNKIYSEYKWAALVIVIVVAGIFLLSQLSFDDALVGEGYKSSKSANSKLLTSYQSYSDEKITLDDYKKAVLRSSTLASFDVERRMKLKTDTRSVKYFVDKALSGLTNEDIDQLGYWMHVEDNVEATLFGVGHDEIKEGNQPKHS
jgi:hypothetical protein